jgi:hypothetical protein
LHPVFEKGRKTLGLKFLVGLVHRALLKKYRGLLMKYRALLMKYKALLRQHRALLIQNRALLIQNRPLSIHDWALVHVIFRAREVVFLAYRSIDFSYF